MSSDSNFGLNCRIDDNESVQKETSSIIKNVIKSRSKILSWLKETDPETIKIANGDVFNVISAATPIQSSVRPTRRKRLQTIRERNRNTRHFLQDTRGRKLNTSRFSRSSTSDEDSADLHFAYDPPVAIFDQKYTEVFKENDHRGNYSSPEPLEVKDQNFNHRDDLKSLRHECLQRSTDSIETTHISDYDIIDDPRNNSESNPIRLNTNHKPNGSLNMVKSSSYSNGSLTLRTSYEHSEEIFFCPACLGRKFYHFDSMYRHLQHYHKLNLKTQDLIKLKAISSSKSSAISSEGNAKKMYSRPFSLTPRTRKRFKSDHSCQSPNKKQKSDQTNDGSKKTQEIRSNVEVVAKSKARLNGEFSCLKCDFTSMNENEFYGHVKSTHIWPNEEIEKLTEKGGEPVEFWCPECSSTFVTKFALQMHLKGNHEFLLDVQSYLEKIGYEGEIPLLENQCDICYSLFAKPWELEKHFRGHGMAFLRRQKLITLLGSTSTTTTDADNTIS